MIRRSHASEDYCCRKAAELSSLPTHLSGQRLLTNCSLSPPPPSSRREVELLLSVEDKATRPAQTGPPPQVELIVTRALESELSYRNQRTGRQPLLRSGAHPSCRTMTTVTSEPSAESADFVTLLLGPARRLRHRTSRRTRCPTSRTSATDRRTVTHAAGLICYPCNWIDPWSRPLRGSQEPPAYGHDPSKPPRSPDPYGRDPSKPPRSPQISGCHVQEPSSALQPA